MLLHGTVKPLRVSLVEPVAYLGDSYGRVPMLNFARGAKPSLDTFLREVWDFDGFGATRSSSTGKVTLVAYDQQFSKNPSSFHVPVGRWSAFPQGAPKTSDDVHGLIPQCLLWHATTVSQVGK